ncbi:MAG: phosphoglucosamine mutase [Alphaproteobacteria bacterium]
MKKKFFGTDGIRGLVNKGHMTPDTLLKIAQAAGKCFQKDDRHHLVVIGKDTRLSGYMVEPALTAGFISMGMDVVLVGPLPTPAVAMLTRSLRADLGVMISASHNPYTDNGIKFFTPEGNKLSDAQELEIEEKIENFTNDHLASSERLGRAKRLDDAPGRYIEFVKSTFPAGLRLDGLKIVIDCANGAAYKIAPMILWELGAQIVPIGDNPNGENINLNCGAVEPQLLSQTVKAHKADIGIGLDGDADRLVVCDENGEIIEGDLLIGLIASLGHKKGTLKGNTVVSTIMANMALETFLSKEGLHLLRTPVGDRYVTEAMKKGGFNVGGEPSGHIVLSDYGTSGDGLVAALQVLSILVQSKKLASEILHPFKLSPQKTRNIKLKNKKILQNAGLMKEIDSLTLSFQQAGGRLVIRPSGTEPVIRIMAEAPKLQQVEDMLSTIETLLKNADLSGS